MIKAILDELASISALLGEINDKLDGRTDYEAAMIGEAAVDSFAGRARISDMACVLSFSEDFHNFLNETRRAFVVYSDDAMAQIQEHCGVLDITELDRKPQCERYFRDLVDEFERWVDANQ